MARHQRLHLVLVLLALALLSTFFQAAEAFGPSISPLERRPTPPAMLLLQAHDASTTTTTTTDPAEQAVPVTKPSRSRARRQLASFDRRDALRAGSALALGLAVLGSTTSSSSSSSIPGSALAAVPPSPAPESTADGLIGGSASTLVAATTETAAAAAAAGADASSSQASSPLADFISGLAGGAASRASKELLLHPLDTIRVRALMFSHIYICHQRPMSKHHTTTRGLTHLCLQLTCVPAPFSNSKPRHKNQKNRRGCSTPRGTSRPPSSSRTSMTACGPRSSSGRPRVRRAILTYQLNLEEEKGEHEPSPPFHFLFSPRRDAQHQARPSSRPRTCSRGTPSSTSAPSTGS